MRRISCRRLWDDEGGAAAVELALAVPLLITVIFGVISYSGYFWIAHELQQLANDSARAAMAGLDAQERQALAATTFADELSGYGNLKAQAATVSLSEQNQTLRLTVKYDASTSPFWAFRAWLPMPSTIVVRAAVVRQGGY